MDLVQVDVVHAQAAQRRVAGLDDVLASKAGAVGPLARRAADLGRHYQFVAPAHLAQATSGDLLADAVGVHVRGVEEIDPALQRMLVVLACLLLFEDPRLPGFDSIAAASKTK